MTSSNKKRLADAKGNAQQRRVFDNKVKQNL